MVVRALSSREILCAKPRLLLSGGRQVAMKVVYLLFMLSAITITLLGAVGHSQTAASIGKEVAVPVHLQDGDEFVLPLSKLLAYGERLFSAKWTSQEGEGRPMVKGTGNGGPLSDPG